MPSPKSKKLRLLFLSMHYAPEPCDSRTSQLAGAMAAKHHDVTALTSFPNYPFGKVYAGYRQKLCERKKVNKVNVVRVPMFPDHSLSAMRRGLSYLSFGFSAAFLGSIFCRRPDLLWIHHPPLTTGIAGYLLAKVKRVPYIYEVHDLWPESLVSSGMIREGVVTRMIRGICKVLHRKAAALIVTSDGMKTHLVSEGVAPEKVHVFPQWADERLFKPSLRNAEFGLWHGLAGKFNVMYAGNLGMAQDLDTVLDAAALLQNVLSIQFVLLGEGVEGDRLKQRTQAEGLKNVRFLGHHPTNKMPKFLSFGDAMLIHLRKDPLFEITIPSKTQVYMAAGRPILCGVNGDGADVVRNAEAGVCFEPGNAESLAEAVMAMYRMDVAEREQFGRNARAAYERQFSQHALCARYESLFQRIVGGEVLSSTGVVSAPAAVGESSDIAA